MSLPTEQIKPQHIVGEESMDNDEEPRKGEDYNTHEAQRFIGNEQNPEEVYGLMVETNLCNASASVLTYLNCFWEVTAPTLHFSYVSFLYLIITHSYVCMHHAGT